MKLGWDVGLNLKARPKELTTLMTGSQVAAKGPPVLNVRLASWSLPLYQVPAEQETEGWKSNVSSCVTGAEASKRTSGCILAQDQDA